MFIYVVIGADGATILGAIWGAVGGVKLLSNRNQMSLTSLELGEYFDS